MRRVLHEPDVSGKIDMHCYEMNSLATHMRVGLRARLASHHLERQVASALSARSACVCRAL